MNRNKQIHCIHCKPGLDAMWGVALTASKCTSTSLFSGGLPSFRILFTSTLNKIWTFLSQDTRLPTFNLSSAPHLQPISQSTIPYRGWRDSPFVLGSNFCLPKALSSRTSWIRHTSTRWSQHWPPAGRWCWMSVAKFGSKLREVASILACRVVSFVLVSMRWNPGRHLGLGHREPGCRTEANWGKGEGQVFFLPLPVSSRLLLFRSSQAPQFARTKMAAETTGWMYPLPTKNACFAAYFNVFP